MMANARPRITLINNQGLIDNGGGPTIIRNIVERLCPRHDITIMSFDPPAETPFNITQVTLPRPKDFYWRLKPLLLARYYKQVLQTVRVGAPDILIAMDCHLGLTFASLPAEKRVYISLSCAPRQEWYGTPLFLPFNFLQYAFLERCLILGADKTVVASESQRREISRYELIPEFNPLVLPPVFAQPGNDRLPALDRPARAASETVFLTVCRLVGVKRVDRVLEVADRLRNEDCRFIIVGDGPLAPELRAEAEKRSLTDRVSFVGPSNNPEKYYAQADILLHPSAYESFGITIFEAMFHGVIPACAERNSATVGIADDLCHGENGILLDFDDLESTHRNLTRVMADRELREHLKRNAQQRALVMLQKDYVGTLAEALDLQVA